MWKRLAFPQKTDELKLKVAFTDIESMQQSIADILSQQNYEYEQALQQDIAREEMEEREERERKAEEHQRSRGEENNQHLSDSNDLDEDENPSPQTLREKRKMFFAKLVKIEALPNQPPRNGPSRNEPPQNGPLLSEPLKKMLRSGRTY